MKFGTGLKKFYVTCVKVARALLMVSLVTHAGNAPVLDQSQSKDVVGQINQILLPFLLGKTNTRLLQSFFNNLLHLYFKRICLE